MLTFIFSKESGSERTAETNEGKEEKLYKKSPLKTKALADQGFDVGGGESQTRGIQLVG